MYPDLVLPQVPRAGVSAHRSVDPARFLARHLADGRIVGVFHGRLEAGPRALGNRSILASPLLPDVVDRLNSTVKFREPFRPFAGRLVDHEVTIGYSFWGFLGAGVLDTPDGGRSHRRVLIDGLLARDHDIVFLQPDRDHTEAGLDLSGAYTWDGDLPEIDVLFLEWRWPIPGRNTTRCGTTGHTCDLHRQQQLLAHYTHTRGTITILWDKDRQLPVNDPLRHTSHVAVCEAAVHPTPGAVSLLFPVADEALDAADPATLASTPRELPLAYVGNQDDRDTAFDTFFAPAAAAHPHLVAGKWTSTQAWPHVSFVGRVPFAEVAEIYRRTPATVLLLPDRYARAGQMTQRLTEAVLAGCLPLTPTSIRSAGQLTPARLHVANGADITTMLTHLQHLTGTSEHVELIDSCLRAVEVFRLSRQLDVLDDLLAGHPGREVTES